MGRARVSDGGLFIGGLRVLFGAVERGQDLDEPLAAFAVSVEYPDGESIDVWSGLDDLELGGTLYTAAGPDVLSIGTTATALNGQNRMTLSLSAIDDSNRAMFLQAPGKVLVTVRFLFSTNKGRSWQALDRYTRGELTRPQLSGGTYTIEISPYSDTLDRGEEASWSNENQERDFPGDKGLEHLRSLSSGQDIRWP